MMKSKQRKNLIKRIEVITVEQAYPLLTFYNAVSIVDLYLNSISGQNQKAPCQETLAVACVLIAAKHDHSGTNGKNIFQSASDDISSKDILRCEFEILNELQFDIRQPTPLEFNLIYQRLLKIQERIEDVKTARKFESV